MVGIQFWNQKNAYGDFESASKPGPNADLDRSAGVVVDSADAPGAVWTNSLKGALDSLQDFMSPGELGNFLPGEDLSVVLAVLAEAMYETEACSNTAKIEIDEEKKRAAMKERLEKLEEATKKLEEAKQKQESSNIADKVKLAFEWIGAALAAVAAVVLIATGVGAVVGGLLLAAAITTIIMAVDSTVSEVTDIGIAGNIAKQAGASEEQIAQADMGFKIGAAVLGIVLSIAAGGASTFTAVRAAVQAGMKAGQAAMEAGSGVGKAVKDFVMAGKEAYRAAMKTTTESLSLAARTAQRTSEGVDAAVNIGSAAIGTTTSVIRKEEMTLRADAKRSEAQSKKSEAVLAALDGALEEAFDLAIQSSQRFQAILDDLMGIVSDKGQTLSRWKFTA